MKLELRKTDEAEALFARVVQRDPKSPHARLGLAIVERSRGQLAPAATALEGVIRDRPDWTLAYFELGRTRLAAAPARCRVEGVRPRRADEPGSRGDTRPRRPEPRGGGGEGPRARQGPGLPRVRQRGAARQGAAGAPLRREGPARPRRARAAGRDQRRAAGSDAAPQSCALLYGPAAGRRRGGAAGASGYAQPHAGGAAGAPGRCSPRRSGRRSRVVATGERLLRVQGETPAAYLVFAIVNEKVDRPAEALEAYQRVLDKEPGHLVAARARARLLARQQRMPEAIRLLEEAAAAQPEGARAAPRPGPDRGAGGQCSGRGGRVSPRHRASAR